LNRARRPPLSRLRRLASPQEPHRAATVCRIGDPIGFTMTAFGSIPVNPTIKQNGRYFE
jgi:hypothetical protein